MLYIRITKRIVTNPWSGSNTLIRQQDYYIKSVLFRPFQHLGEVIEQMPQCESTVELGKLVGNRFAFPNK